MFFHVFFPGKGAGPGFSLSGPGGVGVGGPSGGTREGCFAQLSSFSRPTLQTWKARKQLFLRNCRRFQT